MATIVKGKNPRKPHTVRYQDNGRQRERSFVTKREAQDFIAKYEHDRRASIFVDPKLGNVDFIAYAEQWLEQRPLAAGTKAAYRSALNSHLKPAFAGKTLGQVANDREAMTTLLCVTMPPKVKAGSISQVRSLVTGVMAEAVKAGRLTSHRLADIDIAPREATREEFIFATKEQLQIMADTLRPELNLTIDIMLGCGLRVSEVLAINIADFRDNGKVLRVRQQVARDGSLAALKHRKTGEFRDVPVPGWVWRKVQAHVAQYGTVDGFLFNRDGKRVHYGIYAGPFERAALKAGLESYGPHQLRHTYASTLLAHNVPISDLAAYLGHANINTTYATYGHLVPNAFDRSRDVLESLAI
jgi:integrase